MSLVSIKDIKLSFTNGAAIRIDAGAETPGGIRFQAKLDVICGVDAYKEAIINALQAGTMITTKDILDNSGQEYTVENIEKMCNEWKETKEMLQYIDVIVDGKYEEDKKDMMLQFKGSSNQRTILVKESLESGNVVLLYD